MNPPPPAIGTRGRDARRFACAHVSNRFGRRRGHADGRAGRIDSARMSAGTLSRTSTRCARRRSRSLRAKGSTSQRCVSCHGATGADDGQSASLSRNCRPSWGRSRGRRSAATREIAQAIRAGAAGHGHAAVARLTDADLATMVAYVRTLAMKQPPRPDTSRAGAARMRVEASRDVMRLARRGARCGARGENGRRRAIARSTRTSRSSRSRRRRAPRARGWSRTWSDTSPTSRAR